METLVSNLKVLKYYSGDSLEKKVIEVLDSCKVKYKYQPNGCQRFPDFILTDYNIDLECKSAIGDKPMWNCSYPKTECLYIFSSKKLSKTFVFLGKEMITKEIIEIYEEYKTKHKALVSVLNEKLANTTNNKFNMRIFARNMFVQTSGFSKNLDDYTKEYNPKDNSGQYFTISKQIQQKLIKDLEYKDLSILEPSCGIGHIISLLREEKCSVSAYDIDKDVIKISKKLFPDVKYKCCNFLDENITQKYDLVIANPPYFEIKDVPQYYTSIINGRANIYYLFLYKCINLLNEDGELRFIIPKSFLSNKYAEKLRKYLVSMCEVSSIDFFNSDSHFDNASQNVIILHCKKVNRPAKDNKHVLYINNSLFFVEDKSKLNITGNTISSLGCFVKTGSIVWNNFKELLTNELDIKSLKLYYSSDLSDKDTSKNINKKEYILKDEKINKYMSYGPCILVQRIYNKKIVAKFIEKSNSGFFVENHVNVITGPEEVLHKIYISLLKDTTNYFVNKVFNSTQISKTELQDILQI